MIKTVSASLALLKYFSMQGLKKMKNSAYLINTARGEIVDSDALRAVLEGGDRGGKD